MRMVPNNCNFNSNIFKRIYFNTFVTFTCCRIRVKLLLKKSKLQFNAIAGEQHKNHYLFTREDDKVLKGEYTIRRKGGGRYSLQRFLMIQFGVTSLTDIKSDNKDAWTKFRKTCSHRLALYDAAE